MDDDFVDLGITPDEALAMEEKPWLRAEWIQRHGDHGRPPPGFFGAVVRLAAEAREARQVAARAAGSKTRANRHRRDLERLRAFAAARGERLSPRQRQVAFLCLEQGMTLAEAGARLGISPVTVRRHLQRLRAMLRALPRFQASAAA
jgi:RNA polymerase sigma factor (sigma-70 family)